jgi:ribosome-binding factor A
MKLDNESQRQLKVSRQILKDLSEMFQRDAAAYALGQMVSVTHVRISSDLAYAKVYLSVFPSSATQAVMEHVDKINAELRYELGKRVRHQLRIVPELEFAVDDSLDYVERIETLLQQDPALGHTPDPK